MKISLKATNLEASHISWVSRILEAVLVALEEELELKPGVGNVNWGEAELQ